MYVFHVGFIWQKFRPEIAFYFFEGNGKTCELFSRQGAFFFFNPLLNDVYNVA